MKRSLVVLSFLAIGLFVATTGANAEIENIGALSVDRFLAPGQEGGRPTLVRPVRAWSLGEPEPVPLPIPQPQDPTGERSVSADSKLGPRSTGSELGAGLFAGGALITPRGGTMSTPEQQADRAIDRLIRRLN